MKVKETNSFGRSQRPKAFTLVEVLVTSGILALLLMLILKMTASVADVTSTQAPAFQEARTAFETMTRQLSQAVLNPYLDYDSPVQPSRYLRASELHFVLNDAATLTGLGVESAGQAIFFQAPAGRNRSADLAATPALLNSIGFYVRYSPSETLPPYLSAARDSSAAWRLWMYQQVTEDFLPYSIFNARPQAPSDTSWFRNDFANPARHHVLANHIVLLLIRATYEEADGRVIHRYVYDSRPTLITGAAQPVEMHQLPPRLSVTMVAIDAQTAHRLRAVSGASGFRLADLPPVDGVPAFSDGARYHDDLEALKAHLNARPVGGVEVHYQIFESTVNMGASKWSR